MKAFVEKSESSAIQDPLAKKTKENIKESVENSRDSRAKKFPKNLPLSTYVAIKPAVFKKMQKTNKP